MNHNNKLMQTLSERGFISQCSDSEALNKLLNNKPITLYLGIDPTFHSLHIGHLTPVFMLKHFYDAGNTVIPLMGGGTGRIGDPSGKTEMRQMLSYQDINNNVEAIKNQLSVFFNLSDKQVKLRNNVEWLADLNYIDFLRDIGRHFSVNRMLSFEAYKQRLEKGLSFIEFNYQLLQSYDFYILNRDEEARLQIGGDDQWGNIVAGIDLIRRMCGSESYGLTCPLITTADGKKMGKSEKGAIFLDKNLTTPYDMFQYWRNINDADVGRFLALYTFLPMDEVRELSNAKDNAINHSKERLAYEYVKLIHGEEEANKVRDGVKAAFTGSGNLDNMPSYELEYSLEQFNELSIIDLYVKSNLCNSKSEARRLIEQGGAMINDEKTTDISTLCNSTWLDREKSFILKAGKKKFMRIILK